MHYFKIVRLFTFRIRNSGRF